MEEKCYYSLDSFYRKKFGTKVFKVSLDAGFSCPNKDGSKGRGGCIFCSGSTNIGHYKDSLENQFESIKSQLHRKWRDAKYVAFFEANTNTYASLDTLKDIYEKVLNFDGVVGLSIATRCDAFSEEIYDYLEELNSRTYLTIELGLQSSFDTTLEFINRGHTRDDFTKCVQELKKRNIEIVAHIINGLPFETEEMMLETIKYLNWLKVDGIKFHMLYIEEGTVLENLYKKLQFSLLSKEQYIEILGKQINMLDKEIVVHRLVSGPNNKKLVEPRWLLGKFKLLNDIEKFFKENGVIQGKEKRD